MGRTSPNSTGGTTPCYAPKTFCAFLLRVMGVSGSVRTEEAYSTTQMAASGLTKQVKD